MQYSILSAISLTLYIAVALTSLRCPSGHVLSVAELAFGLVFASVSVMAFERRSTRLFGFVAFGLASTFTDRAQMTVIFPLMQAFRVPTGSVEYSHFSSLLGLHFAILFGAIGYLFGAFIACRSTPPNKASSADS